MFSLLESSKLPFFLLYVSAFISWYILLSLFNMFVCAYLASLNVLNKTYLKPSFWGDLFLWTLSCSDQFIFSIYKLHLYTQLLVYIIFLCLLVSISHFKYIGFHFMCMDWILSWSIKSLGLLLAHLCLPFFSFLL